MPIYEFYCPHCHTVYQFLSRTFGAPKTPPCPGCERPSLRREVSHFAVTGIAREEPDLPMDESKMEGAMMELASHAEGLDEENPQEAARLMKKFTELTGMPLGPGMQEALKRMEAGEDPEAIEAELGDRLEEEDPFMMPGKQAGAAGRRRMAPRKDPTLREL